MRSGAESARQEPTLLREEGSKAMLLQEVYRAAPLPSCRPLLPPLLCNPLAFGSLDRVTAHWVHKVVQM